MRASLLAVALSALLVAGAAAAGSRRYELPAVGLSLEVPASWQRSSQQGWSFVAARPDGEAKLYAKGFLVAGGYDGVRKLTESFARSTAKTGGPHATIDIRGATVAGRRAVEIVVRYGPLTSYIYGVANSDEGYIVDAVCATSYLKEARPAFGDAIRSIRLSTPA